MEDETAFQDLSGFEFFIIILPNSLKKLRLPGKFAKVLDGREPREMKLREAGCRRRLWNMEVVFDADGHMYLGDGWEKFARAHDLRLGHFLVLSYDGHTVLTVKVFDGSMCRRDYKHDDAGSGSNSDGDGNNRSTAGMDIHDGPTSEFRGAELTRFDSNGKEKALRCAAMRNASGVKKPSTFDDDDSSSSCVRTTKSSAEEGSDSDGSQKESSYYHKKSAKMSAISYSSEELSAEDGLSVETANLRTLWNNYVFSSECYLTKAQKVKIHALVEKIQPKITVLVVQMKKTNVNRHGTLTIRRDYACKHFPCENTTVILRLPGKNKDWECTFRIRPSSVYDGGRRNLFLRCFGSDNNIREGDICLFQPMTNVKQRRFIVTVHIIRKGAEVTRFESNGKEKALCCAAMRNASGVKKQGTFDVDDSSSFCVRTTKSSAGEGSDSDGSQKESYCHKKSAKMPAISYSSEDLSAEDSFSVDNSVKTANLRTLSNNYVFSCQCYPTKAQKVKIDVLMEKIQPKFTVLVVQMKKSNVKRHGTLIIQKDYALEHFPCEDTTVILRLPGNNKDWKCTFRISPSNMSDAGRRNLFLPYFGCDNDIKEGDICLFQPMTSVKQRRFIVTVHILRKMSVDHSPGGSRVDIGSNHGRTNAHILHKEPPIDGASERLFMLSDRVHLTRAQEMKLMQKVGDIKFKRPFYVAIMSKSTVCQRGSLNVPMLNFGSRYAARYLIEKFVAGHHHVKRSAIELVLQREGKSRSWPTKLRHSSRGLRVLKGWPSFARDNRLREGDFCLFKLMKNEEPLTMMVYIIRS